MKTKSLTFLIILCLPALANAEHPINDFLMAAEAENKVAEFNDQAKTDSNIFNSWIENAQFRFNAKATDKLNFKDEAQSYEIRVKPKAWGQQDEEKNILNLRLNQYNNSYNQLFNFNLKKRYLKILDYIAQQQKTQYLFKLSDLLGQETAYISSQVLSEKFDAEQLLDAENELEQSIGLARLNLTRLKELQRLLGIPQDTSITIRNNSLDWVIKISDVYDYIANTHQENHSSPDILNAQLNLQLTHAENRLSQSKQQLGINLLSFEYQDSQQDETAFLLGINIPLGTNFNHSESKFDNYKAQSQLDGKINALKQTLGEIKKEVDWLSEDLTLIESQTHRVQQHLKKDYSKTNPKLALNLAKELIEHNKRNVDTKQKILNLYINYLALSGQLIQRPLHNWILHGTPVLD